MDDGFEHAAPQASELPREPQEGLVRVELVRALVVDSMHGALDSDNAEGLQKRKLPKYKPIPNFPNSRVRFSSGRYSPAISARKPKTHDPEPPPLNLTHRHILAMTTLNPEPSIPTPNPITLNPKPPTLNSSLPNHRLRCQEGDSLFMGQPWVEIVVHQLLGKLGSSNPKTLKPYHPRP